MLFLMSLAAMLAAFTVGLTFAHSATVSNPMQPAPNVPPASGKLPPPAPSNSHAVRVGPDAIDGSKLVIVKRNNN